MKIFIRGALAALVFSLVVSPLAGQQKAAPKALRVVATNSWTAALATAAGVKDVVTLAPADLRHPAEYELKPSDVAALHGADLIVSTGFEVMAKRLGDAAGSQGITVLRVDADYSLQTMRNSLMAIAAITGTEKEALESIGTLEGFITSWKAELAADGLAGSAVLAHVFQVPLMQELGFVVKGVFGPGPLEAAQIAKLSPQKVSLIIDNWHNEVGGPLRETLPTAHYASLINFPGPAGTVSLLDVLADNKKRLEEAALKSAAPAAEK